MKENLKSYLLTKVPALAQVLTEWPEANQQIKYPSLVILGNNPQYFNLMPYSVKITDPDDDKKVIVTHVVGQYELNMQLTAWCRNKKERQDIHEALFLALNPQVDPPGLVLQLSDYFDTFASYDISGHELPDDEESAQRREWRVTIQVLGHVKAIIEKEEFSMTTIEQTLETPDTIPEDEE